MGSVYMLVLIQCMCFEGFSSFSSLPTPFLLPVTNVSKFQFDVEHEGHMFVSHATQTVIQCFPCEKMCFLVQFFWVNSCQYILLFCVAEGYVLLNF